MEQIGIGDEIPQKRQKPRKVIKRKEPPERTKFVRRCIKAGKDVQAELKRREGQYLTIGVHGTAWGKEWNCDCYACKVYMKRKDYYGPRG